jgi:NHLM bacteriocin system ABC transporter ATP-binding protein
MGTVETPGLESLGAPFEVKPNRPFLVHDPDSVWLISAGKVDLFLVDTKDGEAIGARWHAVRLEAGEALFGLDPARYGSMGVLASTSPDARLSHLSLKEVGALVARHTWAAALLDTWVEHLATAISNKILPKTFVALEAGKEVVIREEAQPILPLGGVVWVHHRTGMSRFLADPAQPVNGHGPAFFPLSKYGWLEAEKRSQISAISSGSLAALDAGMDGLQAFHGYIFSHLITNRSAAQQKDRERILAQAAGETERIDAALAQLAAPLTDSLPVAVELDLLPSPLFLAAQAVGKASGIRIKPHPDMLRGLTMKNPVAAIAKASRVRSRRVLLKDKWWTRDSGPMIAFIDENNAPVALLPRTSGSYDLFNPADRTTKPMHPELAQKLNGFAYMFYRALPAVRLTAKDLLSFGALHAHAEIWTILLMGTASGLLAMVTPIATGVIFDSVIPGAEKNQLFSLTMFLVIAAISTALFNLVRSIATLRLEGKMDSSIQAAIWDRLLSLPVPFFRDFTSGDLASRSMGINQIRKTLTGSTLSSILTGFFSAFSFFLLFYYSWRLALLAMFLIAIAFTVSTVLGYWQIQDQRDMSKIRGRISGMVLQFINGISKFRVSGTEDRAFVAWARQFSHQKQLSVSARQISNHLTVFNAAFPVICTASIFYYTAYLLSQPGMPLLTTGDFLAFNAAFVQFLTSMMQLSSSVISILGVVPLYERAKPILHALPEVDEAKTTPADLTGAIELNHVTFRYRPDTPLVLRDVSISILPGQFIAIVGPSGCGKSTLMRLLLGFELPESGAVYYDGQDLAGLDIQAVRQQMGVVLQSARLLSGDIFTNIVGSAPLTIDDAWEAARLSGLDQDIRNMPMGMHTVIAEGGGGLSGGQRQRLLIARAIVAKPRILLFDEATSALDNQTQATVSASLEGLQATRVVIAHRLSTIVNADRIFVLDKGMVVQAGTYQELMQQKGQFHDLATRQII